MDQVVIVAAQRTAIGNLSGCFSNTAAHLLGSTVIKSLLDATQIDPKDISEVISGQVLTALCGQNPARQASIAAGIPKEVPAYTINHVCGSGLKSVALAAQSILTGNAEIVIAGGQENMTLAPHAMALRTPTKMGDAKLVDTMIKDGLFEAFNGYHMGITAENIAKQFNISRKEQDEFAALSQQKCEAAIKQGKFKDEIVKVIVKSRKEEIICDQDEFPKSGTTAESLAALRPAFDQDGTVTAGNASGINDGAAFMILMKESEAKKRGLKILAKIASFGQAGVDPKIMGTGPINATKNALQKSNWKISDLDLIEANEAFAAQAIAVNRELGWDVNKVNVNGGAIALGHPIGASGARILVTLIHEMQRTKAQKALATLCIGGGMGVALALSN